MVKKSILAKVGDKINYKLIRDGYKTGKGNVVVTAEMDTKTTIAADVPSTAYASNLDYEVDISGENPPIINIKNDITCPDDTVISKGKYLFYDIGQEYDVKNTNDVIEKIVGIKDYTLNDDGTELTTKLFDYHYKITGKFVNNTIKVGNVIIDESTGIASGFTSSVKLKFEKSTYFTNERRFYTKIKTGNTSGTTEFLWNYTGNDRGVGINNDTWRIWVGSGVNGTSVSSNTSYWTCILQNASGSTLYVLQDNEKYTSSTLPDLSHWVKACSTNILLFGDNDFCYGGSTVTVSEYWTGTIDLSNSWIETDGEKRFLAYFDKPQNKTSLYINTEKDNDLYYDSKDLKINASKIGNPTIDNDGVASNFSTSNYLSSGIIFNPAGKWEQMWKFTTGTLGGYQRITGSPTDYYAGANVVIIDNKIQVWITADNRNWDIANGDSFAYSSDILSSNTTYWVKFTFDLEKYIVSYSTNGKTFTDVITINNSSICKSIQPLSIGCGSGNYPFNGSIDLLNSYIQIGDDKKQYMAELISNRHNISSLYSEFIDNITIPAHALYEYDNGEWKLSGDSPLITQDVTVNADNAEITMKEIEE